VPLLSACATSGEAAFGEDTAPSASITPPDDAPEIIEDTGEEAVPGDPITVFINELMPANDGTLEIDGDTPDWLELYNPGPADLMLGGFTITDDLETPRKAVLDDSLMVPADGFLVLFASDTDAGPAHLPFKLSSEGEALGLFFPSGAPADQIRFGALSDNLSLAREDDGADQWAVTATPTPGSANVIE
jgi:hypothetical protein